MASQPPTLAQELGALPAQAAQILRATPSKKLVLAGLAAWTALFHFLGNSVLGYVNTPSLFGWWWWVYSRPARAEHDGPVQWGRLLDGDESYMAFMPLVAAGLLWWKREEWARAPKRVCFWGLGPVALGLGVHWAGFMVQQTRFSLAGFLAGVFGLGLLAWGRAWLRLAFFPFCFLAFCMPLGNMAEAVTFPLRLWATELTGWIARVILGIPVMRTGTSLWDPAGRYQYEVAAACSGIRSLTAILVLAMIFSYVMLERPWKRGILIAAAFPLAVAGNVLRLLVIILAAEWFGRSAGNAVHDSGLFSLLPYVPALGGIALMGRLLKSRPPAAAPVPAEVRS